MSAAILREAGRTAAVAENRGTGGLSEEVARLLMREGVRPPAFRPVALPDAFLATGAPPTLHDRHGISTEAMTRSIEGWP